ncbi:MAG: mechanosensitive ion channel family protein [Thiovulaceae bacterium]|nr:mechanosensitive ion channel family protein [Sulfurimonadaceae bacterium]
MNIPTALESELLPHIIVFSINIFLFLISPLLLKKMYPHDQSKASYMIKLSQGLNILFFIFHSIDISLLIFLKEINQDLFTNLALSIVIFYSAIFSSAFLSTVIRRNFGEERQLDTQTVHYDNHSSRIMDIFNKVIFSLIVIYLIIITWNFDSILEAGGLIGILFAFLALTNAVWAPDLYYGIVILNSKMINVGDVIKHGDEDDEYIIYQISFIYTILLDIRNDHRTVVRNSVLIANNIENLSKRASSGGLRYALSYKVGYPKQDPKLGSQVLEDHKVTLQKMFQEVLDQALENAAIMIKSKNSELELLLKSAGDYALEWEFYFHIDALPNTLVTKSIRNYLVRTPRLLNELVLDASYKYNIDLSTPLQIQGKLNS